MYHVEVSPRGRKSSLNHTTVDFHCFVFFQVEALKVVLAEGYSVDVTSSVKKRPLHVAVTVNTAAIPLLLSAGCDVTARDGVHGNTPLHSACSQYEEEAILQLVRAGARVNALNWSGETPLHCLLQHACDWGSFHAKSRQSLARCLIHVGMVVTSPRPNQTDWRGRGGGGGGGGGRRRSYKITRVYQQLVSETRRRVSSLQHLCRLRVREACEGVEARAGERKKEERGRDRSLAQLIEELEVSCYLKEYLLYKRHVFDRNAFSPHKTKELLPSLV